MPKNTSGFRIIRNNANLRGADLSGTDLKMMFFPQGNLNRANLSRTDLSEAILSHASFRDANLVRTNFGGADLKCGDFSAANLAMATLSKADLTGVNFCACNLTGATLIGCRVVGTNFTNTIFGGTTVTNVDLREAKGLDQTSHIGPSAIGLDTLYISHGAIPESFLRGTGATGSLLQSVRSLANSDSQLYSCFISHSSKDSPFVERLHADLRRNNVRCWYAPKDLKIGDDLRDEIENAILKFDRVLIVLSINSITSNWVKREVEAAFDEERKRAGAVLFPIRLDDTVMHAGNAWAADIRRTRHMGDFSGWQNHDAYDGAFKRLLRDLERPS